MIDKAFGEFAQQNLATLDELARRYAEYRNEMSQSWWDELRALIQKSTPTGYAFEGVDRDLFTRGERVCGWSRGLGDQSKATIAFGVNVTVPDLARGRWPLMAKTCWTGARVWASTDSQNIIFNVGRQQIVDTEPRDNDWLFWRYWVPRRSVDRQDLHILEREAGTATQEEIVDELELWRQSIDPILSQLPRQESPPVRA
jgi:hypothetical protein